MRIRLAVPESVVSPTTLDAALEAVTRTNEALITSGLVPTSDEAIRRGVKWRPEPPGDEHFDPATTVMVRGHGDCDDLAPFAAATRRVTGEDPGARAGVIQNGPNHYHAVVFRSDGSIEDPSAEAGMYDYHPPCQPRFAGHTASRPLIQHRVHGDGYVARCDVPWQGTRMAISGHGWGHSFAEAVDEAVAGACVVGEHAGVIHPEHAQRLLALRMLLAEADPNEVARCLATMGHRGASSVVGSLFGGLLKTIAHVVPVPGVAQAYDLASGAVDMLKSHGGGHQAAAPAEHHEAVHAAMPHPAMMPPPHPMQPPVIPIIVKF